MLNKQPLVIQMLAYIFMIGREISWRNFQMLDICENQDIIFDEWRLLSGARATGEEVANFAKETDVFIEISTQVVTWILQA